MCVLYCASELTKHLSNFYAALIKVWLLYLKNEYECNLFVFHIRSCFYFYFSNTFHFWNLIPWIKWAMFFCPTPTPSKFGLKGAPIPFGSSWSCTRGLGETSFDSRSYDFELSQTSVTNNLCPLVLSYLDVRVIFFFSYFDGRVKHSTLWSRI